MAYVRPLSSTSLLGHERGPIIVSPADVDKDSSDLIPLYSQHNFNIPNQKSS